MPRLSLQFSSESAYNEYYLPAVDNRRLQLDLGETLGYKPGYYTLLLEVWDGEWQIVSGKGTSLYQKGTDAKQFHLTPGCLINGKLDDGTVFAILASVQSGMSQVFGKYSLSGLDEVTIGRDASCHISINDGFVSKTHTRILRQGGQFIVEDLSTNGTYRNNRRIAGRAGLNPFDILHIAGRKIVFLGDALAISGTGVTTRLSKYDFSQADKAVENPTSVQDPAFFSRAPRDMEPLDEEPVEIEAPPVPARQRQTPLLFIIGPSVTMPLPILVSMMLNMSLSDNGASKPTMYLVTGISVILSASLGAFWAFLNQRHSKKNARQDEDHRTSSYRKYIGKTESLLREKHAQNAAILHRQYMPAREVLSAARGNRKLLWNRNVHHKDFLTVRLGQGRIDMRHTVLVPKERFSLVDDPLQEEPFKLRDRYRNLGDAPKLLNLREVKQLGVTGEPERVAAMCRVIAAQLALTHSYTDMRMAFLCDARLETETLWARWLPHVFSSDRKLRLVASSATETQEVLYHLANEIRGRASGERASAEGGWFPHYVLFVSDPSLIEDDPLYKYISDDKDYGITAVFLYGETDKLPNEVKCIIQCGTQEARLYSLDRAKEESDFFLPDPLDPEQAEEFARMLSGIFVRELAAEGEVPQSVGFLEMLGAPNVQAIPVLRMWKENRTYESMRALVGYRSNSLPMFLDIHEKQHGPHGLVAGTTGSGKSELLQTYILSMMLSYHPDEVAFILIDYKGGGMANIFAGEPHVAGTITNLDGNQTRRALVSIKSEILRRQTAFNLAQVNHIDLYARLYREGKVSQPLPHLVIIADEFAELKREQPDFIKELVSTARVGRSLGIHLILATQKPTGVVDDEIWSNSRFRLCLKVQDRQDSNEMLRRPDAAYLVNPGRAYLQVGSDEIFELFQSGYSGGEYVHRDRMVSAKDSVVMMIDRIGHPSVVRSAMRKKNSSSPTEIQACVKLISEVAEKNGIGFARPLWLPELPGVLRLGSLAAQDCGGQGLMAVLGLLDDPVRQKQTVYVIDFMSRGNLLVTGSAGSGKSVVVQTILTSLVRRYGSMELNVYIMDFSSRMQGIFVDLPQVGCVVYSDDTERIRRLFAYLDQEMDRRNSILEQRHVGSFAEYKKAGGDPLPAIVFVLDNYSVFNELHSEHEDQFIRITREGQKCGIYTLLTNTHAGGVKYKVRQNFTNALAMNMSERADYMDVFGRAPEFAPGAQKGRGLVLEGDLLEVQVAIAGDGENDYQRNHSLIGEFAAAAARSMDMPAHRIPRIPREQSHQQFLTTEEAKRMLAQRDTLPLGYDCDSAEAIGLDLCGIYCFSITDNSGRGSPALLGNIARAGRQMEARVLYASQSSDDIPDDMAREHPELFAGPEGVFSLFSLLRGELEARSKARKELLAAQKRPGRLEFLSGTYKPVFVLVEDFSELLDTIYADPASGLKENAEMFFRGGAGLGVFFFALFPETVGQSYTAAYRNFVSHRTGLHLGGRASAQKLFDFDLGVGQQMKPEEYNIAYIKRKDGTSKVFIPVPQPE